MTLRKRTALTYNYAEQGITRYETDRSTPGARARVVEDSVLIGHGSTRWDHAWRGTLSWALQRHAGYSVLPGPSHSPDGAHPSSDTSAPPITPGQQVRLSRHFGPISLAVPVRIVYVVDETHRKGFAFGTLKGHPVSGEVAFIVERHPDDSVWLTLRSFRRPGKGLWRLAYPVVLLLKDGMQRTYFDALAGPLE